MRDAIKVPSNPTADGADRSSAPSPGPRPPRPSRRKLRPSSRVPAADRSGADEAPPSLPVKDRAGRTSKLHGQHLERSQRAKKYQRLKSLSERLKHAPAVYEALERREKKDDAQRETGRGLRSSAVHELAIAAIERRRVQYLAIPFEPELLASQRTAQASRAHAQRMLSVQAICSAVLAVFALPLLVALIADIVPQRHAQAVAISTSHFSPRQEAAGASQRGHHAPAIQQRHQPAPARASAQRPVTVQLPIHKAIAAPLVKRAPAASVFAAIFGESPATPLPAVAPPLRTPAATAVVGTHVSAHPGQWALSADGHWTTTVRAPRSMHGVQIRASTGELLALEPSAAQGQGALLRLSKPQSVVVTMTSSERSITQKIAAPEAVADFSVTAQPIGPHLVNVGWLALPASSNITSYKVYRSNGEGDANELVAEVPPQQNSLRDTSVEPGSRYRYFVEAGSSGTSIHANAETITTPSALPDGTVTSLAGKGMFLYFSSFSGDPHSYRKYDPDTVISAAQNAGIRVIELRMARGTSFMAETPSARAWLNHIIDAASAAGIKLVAWTVPRRVTTEDLQQAVAAAAYTTPAGNGFIGLALDLETGPRYMGDGVAAKNNMVSYIDAVRSAVGPHYLLIATVASPMMGHLTNADYPYARIAAYADIMQPMEYWHYFDESAHHEYAHREVAGAASATVLRTRALAGRDIPVNIAGQSVDLQGTGAPSGREIRWSLDAAKSVGAIGETFFDWAGTRPDGWAAIQAFEW